MTEAQVAALEQWAKQERDYATEMGGTGYTSVNKLRDVLALCAAWREGQEDNLTLQLIIDGVNHDMRCDDGSCLRCQRDAAVARAEQAEAVISVLHEFITPEAVVEWIECPECGGSGVYLDGPTGDEACDECDGSGIVSPFPAAGGLIAAARAKVARLTTRKEEQR